jgi:hypothetical protein
MSKFAEFLTARKRLFNQDLEIKRLQAEVAQLKAQNTSMREGMRRCVSCEYRIDFKNRQHPDN